MMVAGIPVPYHPMFSFFGENFIFLELRGTPVVIKQLSFRLGGL